MGRGKKNCGMQKDDVKRRIEHKSADKLFLAQIKVSSTSLKAV